MDIYRGDFNAVLNQICKDFNWPAKALTAYSRRDKILGKDRGNPVGTHFTSDGKLLYALVRHLKPAMMLEIGTHFGGSATHIAAAMDLNGSGALYTVDIEETSGRHIPAEYQDFVTVVHANIDHYLPQLVNQKMTFDCIFEDGAHSEGQVHNIYKYLPLIMNEGGYIISHDVAMNGVQQYIVNGMRKGGANLMSVRFYQVGDTPGVSIYQYRSNNHEPQ